jgi:hypothetical protein
MKMNFKILSAVAFAGIILASCSKSRLEPVPQTFIIDPEGFKTPERALQQVNGMYSALKAGQFYGGRYLVYQDVRGEEFLNVTNNGVTAFLTWNFTVTPTSNEVQNFWSSAYAAINRANVVIAGVEGSTISDSLKNDYIAEAKVVRAISYYSLLQLYSRPFAQGGGSTPGVPLRLNAETGLTTDDDLARASVSDVYAQIIKDLNEAEADLPAKYSSATLNTTRAHKHSAIALKSRVYLTMGNWAGVIAEGDKIVSASAPFQAPASGVGHKLEPSIATVFTTAVGYTGTEAILSMPFTATDVPGTQNSLASYYNPGPDGNGDFSLNTVDAGIAANAGWKSTDARRVFNVPNSAGTRTFLRKWPRNAGTNPDWTPVVRYAEVMLNLSEALARENGLDSRSIALLNAVRQRSDASTTFAPASVDELISAILTERRIELLGEGFRTTDITRTGTDFPAKGSVSSLPSSAPQYIWPISNAEIITNKAVQQNNGY